MKLLRRYTYNALVRRAHAYLVLRRRRGTWERHLPTRIFDPQLWLWERRSIARGVGWGSALAITPIPLQSLSAAFMCLWVRGNVPMAMLSCWISFPGYQIVAWPLQWALGAFLLSCVGVSGSGMTLGHLSEIVQQWHLGWEGMLAGVVGLSFPLFVFEFLLGCLVSALVLGFLSYYTVIFLPRRFF